jgi:SAM-dependent methyltransferase
MHGVVGNRPAGVFQYRGKLYPDYIKNGNACRFITPIALEFCKGYGFDIGAGRWPLPGSRPVDIVNGEDATQLPDIIVDYIFSSHCLEHLVDPVAALEHWKSHLKPGRPMFLYLPHPEMEYWLPQHNRKHLHTWHPDQMQSLLEDLGFLNVLRSERDMYWSFSVVGFNGVH